jgi:DtxR family transcriptional regulator, Mn-dependent transcriptional regulator
MIEIVDRMVWLFLLTATAVLVFLAPGWGLLARWRRWKQARQRTRIEDALKHLIALSDRGQSGSPESLAGGLGLKQKELVELLSRMESSGLIHSTAAGIQLSSEGARLAMQIVRAHRMWERYLADEAGMPLIKLHGAAEKAEHRLTVETVDALDAHLGHPEHDPHGDPIPRPDGTVATLGATPLTDWSTGDKAHIVHVEDEPEIVFRQIAALGFNVGDPVRILERGADHIVVAHGDAEHRLAPVVAVNIHVNASTLAPAKPKDAITLAELEDGAEAVVIGIDPHYRGFARRRLLDLGLTPNTRVTAALENAFGDPRAYLVRGTLIALRRDQASLIWMSEPSEDRRMKEAISR